MGVSIYLKQSRRIFVVGDNHRFINKRDPHITEQFGHITVDYVDQVVHLEESTMVFGSILFFPNTDALSNFIKLLPCNYSTKKGRVTEDIYLLYRKKSPMVYPG